MKDKVLLLALGICAIPLTEVVSENRVYFDDGQVHRIMDDTHLDDIFFLDFNRFNSPGTHLEVVEGGRTNVILTYNISTVAITGGIVDGFNVAVLTYGDSTATITGGRLIGDVAAHDSSQILFGGGHLNRDLIAYDDAVLRVQGGSIDGALQVHDDGIIYLLGDNFSVGGVDLTPGDNLRDYATLVLNPHRYVGTVTGTLSDGSTLDNAFWISVHGNPNIIVIPEPATVSLLALGVLALRRRSTV